MVMDPEADYPYLFTANRLFATLLILLFAAGSIFFTLQIDKFGEIFENMVEGGVSAMPVLTEFYVEYHLALAGALALVGICALWFVWSSRRMAFIGFATIIALFIFCLQSVLVYFAVVRPLSTLVAKFHE